MRFKELRIKNIMHTLLIIICHHRRTKYWAHLQVFVSSVCRIEEGCPLWGHGSHPGRKQPNVRRWAQGSEASSTFTVVPSLFSGCLWPWVCTGQRSGLRRLCDLWMPRSAFLASLNHSKASQPTWPTEEWSSSIQAPVPKRLWTPGLEVTR